MTRPTLLPTDSEQYRYFCVRDWMASATFEEVSALFHHVHESIAEGTATTRNEQAYCYKIIPGMERVVWCKLEKDIRWRRYEDFFSFESAQRALAMLRNDKPLSDEDAGKVATP